MQAQWCSYLEGASDEQLYSLQYFVRDGGRDPRATVLVQENGACLELNSESCHRHGPSPTLGKMSIKRASSQIRNEERGQGLLARFSGLCLTHRGAEREDLAL